MENAMNQGTKEGTKLTIITPLVHMTKEEIVKKALEMDVPLHYTWSCYKNEKEACGLCDSCRLRLKGFEKAGVTDKIPYVNV
jgi:7-cyano-7-deazaguanine synthase